MRPLFLEPTITGDKGKFLRLGEINCAKTPSTETMEHYSPRSSLTLILEF